MGLSGITLASAMRHIGGYFSLQGRGACRNSKAEEGYSSRCQQHLPDFIKSWM